MTEFAPVAERTQIGGGEIGREAAYREAIEARTDQRRLARRRDAQAHAGVPAVRVRGHEREGLFEAEQAEAHLRVQALSRRHLERGLLEDHRDVVQQAAEAELTSATGAADRRMDGLADARSPAGDLLRVGEGVPHGRARCGDDRGHRQRDQTRPAKVLTPPPSNTPQRSRARGGRQRPGPAPRSDPGLHRCRRPRRRGG